MMRDDPMGEVQSRPWPAALGWAIGVAVGFGVGRVARELMPWFFVGLALVALSTALYARWRLGRVLPCPGVISEARWLFLTAPLAGLVAWLGLNDRGFASVVVQVVPVGVVAFLAWRTWDSSLRRPSSGWLVLAIETALVGSSGVWQIQYLWNIGLNVRADFQALYLGLVVGAVAGMIARKSPSLANAAEVAILEAIALSMVLATVHLVLLGLAAAVAAI